MCERSRFVGLPIGRLFVHEWGAIDDPRAVPFVFWHALGSATSGAYLAEVAPLLASRHRVRVVAPDAPGFGRSPALGREGYALANTAELLVALLDRLELARPVLAGHSWGGAVACATAARPGGASRGLVLLDSGHLDYQDTEGFDPDATFEQVLAEMRRPERRLPSLTWPAFVAEVRDELARPVPQLETILRAGVRVSRGRVREIATPEIKAAIRLELGRERVSATWEPIARSGIPVLLMTATEPAPAARANADAAARFVSRVPRATWVPVPGARHDLLLDAGPVVAETIGTWLPDAG